MAKVKGKQLVAPEPPPKFPLESFLRPSHAIEADKKANGSKSSPEPALPPLHIGRNKHWKYISTFHGGWLQMPIEILETFAHINYNTPRPRPVDPATFFDLVKVRRHVDEAMNLAVRAASDIASPTLTSVSGGFLDQPQMNNLNMGGSGHGAKLSRERKFRMREQASQKLARAYRLDEIAASVATMQGASPLDDIGSLVMQRNAKDPDAVYAHFFHEKIPSRQLEESTSIQPLTDILLDHPSEPEVLRTRATVKAFKQDLEGAVQDITHALSICRFRQPSHIDESRPQAAPLVKIRRRPQDVILTEKEQPSSLESQLLFQRGAAHLVMAYNGVLDGLPSSVYDKDNPTMLLGKTDAEPRPDNLSKEEERRRAELRKLVKVYAKRAVKDFLAFLGHFDYSPNVPLRFIKDFNERINLAAQGTRNPRSTESPMPSESPHTVYTLADLFAPVPPTDLPPYSPDGKSRLNPSSTESQPTYECASFHPLLVEALHSLLLAHCLAQTSARELQRHALMVARLSRLSDGYPVFQPCRSSARSDWMEVLRSTNNWLGLNMNWEDMCAAAPLPGHEGTPEKSSAPHPGLAAHAAAALVNGSADSAASATAATEEMRKGRQRRQAILDALSDERVNDEASFRAAILARERRNEEDRKAAGKSIDRTIGETAAAAASNHSHTPRYACGHADPDQLDPALRRTLVDGEFDFVSERAAAIGLWVRQAPMITGLTKRKKKPKKTKVDEVTQDMADLTIDGEVAAEA